MVGQRHRPGDGAGGHLGEKALLLLGRADLADHGANCVTVARSGPGAMTRPSSSTTHGRLDEGQANATVVLGNGQGGPVRGDHGGPELLGRLARLDDGAHELDGAFLLEEGADRGTQLLLLSS